MPQLIHPNERVSNIEEIGPYLKSVFGSCSCNLSYGVTLRSSLGHQYITPPANDIWKNVFECSQFIAPKC